MVKAEPMPSPNLIEDHLESFESAQRESGDVDLSSHLPPRDHPAYGEVLVELIRLDLEYGWRQLRARSLSEYVQRFPQLGEFPDALQQLSFEEYRQRVQAGLSPRPEEYAEAYGVRTGDWPRVADVTRRHAASAGAALDADVSAESTARTVAAVVKEFRQAAQQSDEQLAAWCASTRESSAPAEMLREVHSADPAEARRVADALADLPQTGSELAGFRLVRELGQGAFGRVFLAQQPELADRFVVLKVSADAAGEAQFLARLQHTNIVPIYSIHRARNLHATCMPYLGATTLADVIRRVSGRHALPTSGRELITTLLDRASTVVEEPVRESAPPFDPAEVRATKTLPVGSTVILEKLNSFSYVEAVLWVAARLADGLAHAHERGILHRDLKPANILLTDEGQPMLLDFNLATDTQLRNSPSALLVGGTMPYMAPEQLLAYQSRRNLSDPRGDLFSLGVILYELLTGRHPYPARLDGPMASLMVRMVSERLKRPPGVRPHNQAVSPAVESIVRHCLEPNPANRYQTARELQEDIQRQLEHQPLRHARECSLKERMQKWMRRHPRLSSSTSIGAAAALVVVGLVLSLVMVNRRGERLEAVAAFAEFSRDASEASFLLSRSQELRFRKEGLDLGRRTLSRYDVLDDPAWRERSAVKRLPEDVQVELAKDTGELLLQLASAALEPATLSAQGQRPSQEIALAYNEQAERCFPPEHVPRALWRQRAELLEALDRMTDAQRAREREQAQQQRTASDYHLEAKQCFDVGRYREALSLVRQATELDPQNFWAWFRRGQCFAELGNLQAAIASYDVCVALRPEFPWAFWNRGLAYSRIGNSKAALADLNQVVEKRPDDPHAYFDRARAYHELGKHAESLQDLDRAVKSGCGLTRVYFFRSRVKALLGDKDGARRDQDEGMRLEPADDLSWNARGYARLSTDPKGALSDFESALQHNPRSLDGLVNKAHVYGELFHKNEDAVAALDRAVQLYPDHAPTRVSRGVHLARLGKRDSALRDAQEALLLRAEPATFYQVADIYALTSKTNPDDALKAMEMLARALRGGFGLDILAGDPDLDPIRNRPDFKRMVESARGLRPGP